jgi:RNA polymerase sigma-70 factor, ECF subfamily
LIGWALYYAATTSVKHEQGGGAQISEPRAPGRRFHERKASDAPTAGVSDDDGLLLRRCRSGDESGWRELVQRHTRRVFSIAYRFSGRVDEAEDLTQEVFVKVYQSLARYEPAAGSFSTWLGTVARNHAIDHYRRRREERSRVTEDSETLPGLPDRAEPVDAALVREERAQLVRRAVRALPAQLREAVVLCDLQGMSYEEIAAALTLPLGTVKSRINRGRLELARRLLGRRAELQDAR